MIEDTRQNCIQLRLQPGRASHTYSLLANLRAYLALADAVAQAVPVSRSGRGSSSPSCATISRGWIRIFARLSETLDARLISPDPANLARYAEVESQSCRARMPAKPRVVFFGDSITDFWRLNEYFPDSDYINRGIAGQTTGADGPAYSVRRVQSASRTPC